MTQSSSSNPFRIEIQPPRVIPPRPAWVPPPGYIADVPALNYPVDVTPAIYTRGDMNTAFNQWSGSAVLYDFSPLGAQLFQAAGHESSTGQANIQQTLAFDFTTLKWSAQNVPLAANPNSAFEALKGTAPDGTPYNPHSYLGLQEMPRAWGGGPQGSLVRMMMAGTGGTPYYQTIGIADVSKILNGYTPLKISGQTGPDSENNQVKFSVNSTGGSYPLSVQDIGRQGWWLDVGGNHDYTLFISKSGAVTQTPAIHGNNNWACLMLWEAKNLLILATGGSEGEARTMRIRDLTTGTTRSVQMNGVVPGGIKLPDGSVQYRPEVLGLQWVEELGCLVGLDAETSPPTICKITPPAVNPESAPWTTSVVQLSHWNSGDPAGGTAIRYAQNGNFSKFRWVKTLSAFVLATSSTTKPQVFSI